MNTLNESEKTAAPNPVSRARRRPRWLTAVLYGGMVLVIFNLLIILNLLNRIQESKDFKTRIKMAHQVSHFFPPEGYELTSALYTIHPRFFVLTHTDTGQKIRVMEKRWWFLTRTPEEFREKFWRPGQWVRKPGLGYRRILIEETGMANWAKGEFPYIVGTLGSGGKDESGPEDKGLVGCIYDATADKSLYLFSSAPASVFNVTHTLELAESMIP